MLSRNLQEVIDRFCYVVQDNASNHTTVLYFPPINLPFIKPVCVSLIINGNRGLILLAITAEAILRSVFNKLIGLLLLEYML